jgi:alanyl-tRNA synthetase
MVNPSIRSAHEIRRAYIDFFKEREHVEVPGAPLVPKGDPTLLFTSAGMVQFKEYYLRPDNLPYKRATSVQKCLRAGDLESVGKTLRHHTFFEMLGNFSFGDYFKHEAIQWAWEFVIDLLRLQQDKLSVSIFDEDDEAFRIWNEEIGIPPDKIVRLGRDDNFWGPVGRTGVCGPCSEIYYDTGRERGCGRKTCATGCDCDRYLEFWNLVFPQFFLEEGGEYRPLVKPGIDTGLGLERLATIMQGADDNFHTDLFQPLIDMLRSILPSSMSIGEAEAMGINMVADHARALTFTISEGIYPSNEGRGYLLRRLLRRALTRFYSYGVEKPFLHTLVDVVADTMKIDYPELDERRREASMIIHSEEESFFRTLEEGKSRFASLAEETKEAGERVIGGDRVFVLYDTFGLPLELAKVLAEGSGLSLDEDGFERAMEEQRKRAQEQSGFAGEDQELVSMTEVSEGPSSRFIGYERIGGEAEIRRYRIVDKSSRGDAAWTYTGGSAFEIVVDETPFYATSGGQVADHGRVEIGGHRLGIRDVFKRGGDIVHLAESPETADTITEAIVNTKRAQLRVDTEQRLQTASNHTATHLLHAALRRVVGRHVTQAGSLVDGERLRFDFSHFKALTGEERGAVEKLVNRWVRESIAVRTEWMEYQEAVERGAMALFDEKYGAKVRVVMIEEVSTELCGGTHVDNTGRIGLFLMISESSVAAGIRRIEALTGTRALEHVQSLIERNEEAATLLRVSPPEVMDRIRGLLGEIDVMRKQIRRMARGEVGAEIDRIIRSGVMIDGVLVASGRVSVDNLSALRNQADVFRSKVASGVAVLSAPLKGKLQFVATVTDDLITGERLSADGLVRELGAIAGGSGGGKKHLAQLGTKDINSEERVFSALVDLVRGLLGGRGSRLK